MNDYSRHRFLSFTTTRPTMGIVNVFPFTFVPYLALLFFVPSSFQLESQSSPQGIIYSPSPLENGLVLFLPPRNCLLSTGQVLHFRAYLSWKFEPNRPQPPTSLSSTHTFGHFLVTTSTHVTGMSQRYYSALDMRSEADPCSLLYQTSNAHHAPSLNSNKSTKRRVRKSYLASVRKGRMGLFRSIKKFLTFKSKKGTFKMPNEFRASMQASWD